MGSRCECRLCLDTGQQRNRELGDCFTADRKTLNDHIGLYSNSVYARNDSAGTTTTTANAVQADCATIGTSQPKCLVSEVQTSIPMRCKRLNLRSVFGGGLGFHAIKNDVTTIDLLGGINYTRESYGVVAPNPAFTRSFAAATLGEELMHKWGKSTVVTQKLYFFPDFNDAGQYRATFNLGTVTKLNKWSGWQNAFGDIYVTNPPAGKKTDDVLLTTGLNITFTH